MGKLIVNGAAPQAANRIVNMPAGETFEFTSSRKGNNGLCVRIRDSKGQKKGRFVNLDNGKLLTASATDTGRPVDIYADVD